MLIHLGLPSSHIEKIALINLLGSENGYSVPLTMKDVTQYPVVIKNVADQ